MIASSSGAVSARRSRLGARAAGIVAACAMLAGCGEAREDPRLEPSAAARPFDAARYRDFADYAAQTRASLVAHKVYLDPANAAVELDAATPFERRPASDCPAHGPRRGVLSIHGLSDMPFAMRDLADAFAGRCFLARSLLLPGHGARPGDLLTVTRADWLEAGRFGVATLEDEVDQVYVGGFSLGGLLATHLALDDPAIAGVFAFSPALALQRAWGLRLTPWLRHAIDWVDTDPADDFARYEATPSNGLAETHLLTRELDAKLAHAPLTTPVFLAQGMDDAVIDGDANLRLFETSFANPASRALIYAREPPDAAADARTRHVDSDLPERRIAGFSHQALHVAPDNPHYGAEGA